MNFLRRFFYGRNGTDALSVALLFLAVLLIIVARITHWRIFSTLYMVAVFLCIFRMLSRNITKRREENTLFVQKTGAVGQWFHKISTPSAPVTSTYHTHTHTGAPKKDRANYKYLKCPNCKQPLRVPRGKGNIKIRCSSCALEFFKKV